MYAIYKMTKTKSSAKAKSSARATSTANAKQYQHQSQVVNFSVKNYVMPSSYKKHTKAKRKVVKVIDEEKTLAYMVQLKRMAETELYYKLNNLNNAKRDLADAEYAYRKKIAEDEKERSQKEKEAIDKQLADMKEYQEALQEEIRKLREQIADGGHGGGGDDPSGGGEPADPSGDIPVPPIPDPDEIRRRREEFLNRLTRDYMPSRTELGTADIFTQEESSVVIEEIDAVNDGRLTLDEAARNVAERAPNVSADRFAEELHGRLDAERLNQAIQAKEIEHNNSIAEDFYTENGRNPTIDEFIEAREMIDVASQPNTIRTRANRGRFAGYGEDQTLDAYRGATEHLQDQNATEIGALDTEIPITESYRGFTTDAGENTYFTNDNGVRYDTGRRMNPMEQHEWLNDNADHIAEHGNLTAEEQAYYDEMYEPDESGGELETSTEPLTAEDQDYMGMIDETSDYLESQISATQAENMRLQQKMDAGEIPDAFDPNYNPRTPTQDAVARMEQGTINSREGANLRALTAETSGIGTISRSDPRLGRMTRSMTEEMGIRTPPREETIGTSTFTEAPSPPPSPPREVISPPKSPPPEITSDSHLGAEALDAHQAVTNAAETLNVHTKESVLNDKEALSSMAKNVSAGVKGSKLYEVGKASMKPSNIAKGLGASIVGGLAVGELDKSEKGDFNRGAEGKREHSAVQEGITLGLIGADIGGAEGAAAGLAIGATAGYAGTGLTQGLDAVGGNKHFDSIAGQTLTATTEGAGVGALVGGAPGAAVGAIGGFLVGGVSATLHEAFAARKERLGVQKHRTPLNKDDYRLYEGVKEELKSGDLKLTKDQQKSYDDLSTTALIFGAPKGY